jgi:transposase
LQIEELEASATEDELLAEMEAARTTIVAAFSRRRPSGKPFPEHLPRERVLIAAPTACPCCGGTRRSKFGENATETLEVVPALGRYSSMCARRSPAAIAKLSTSRPRPFM